MEPVNPSPEQEYISQTKTVQLIKVKMDEFREEDITMKAAGRLLTISAKHQMRWDTDCFVTRHYLKQFKLVKNADLNQISCYTRAGYLFVVIFRTATPAEPQPASVDVQIFSETAISNVIINLAEAQPGRCKVLLELSDDESGSDSEDPPHDRAADLTIHHNLNPNVRRGENVEDNRNGPATYFTPVNNPAVVGTNNLAGTSVRAHNPTNDTIIVNNTVAHALPRFHNPFADIISHVNTIRGNVPNSNAMRANNPHVYFMRGNNPNAIRANNPNLNEIRGANPNFNVPRGNDDISCNNQNANDIRGNPNLNIMRGIDVATVRGNNPNFIATNNNPNVNGYNLTINNPSAIRLNNPNFSAGNNADANRGYIPNAPAFDNPSGSMPRLNTTQNLTGNIPGQQNLFGIPTVPNISFPQFVQQNESMTMGVNGPNLSELVFMNYWNDLGMILEQELFNASYQASNSFI